MARQSDSPSAIDFPWEAARPPYVHFRLRLHFSRKHQAGKTVPPLRQAAGIIQAVRWSHRNWFLPPPSSFHSKFRKQKFTYFERIRRERSTTSYSTLSSPICQAHLVIFPVPAPSVAKLTRDFAGRWTDLSIFCR